MGLGRLLLTALAAFVAGVAGMAGAAALLYSGPSLRDAVVVPLMLTGFFMPAISVAILVGSRLSPARPAPAPEVAPAGEPDDGGELAGLRAALAVKGKSPNAGALAALLLVVFVLVGLGDSTFASLLVLVGVLLFHEGGHALGMLAFGYRDVRVFFLPFLGAATTGVKEDAPAWQQAVVLLLGPLPGIALGACLLVASRGAGLVGELGRVAVYINVFNLLPFEPLDGGRLLGVTLFSRSRWLEAAFAVLGALGIGALAFRLGAWPLGVLAWLALVSVPYRLRLAGAAQRVKEVVSLPIGPRPEALPETTLSALDEEGRKLSPQSWVRLPARVGLVRALHGRVQMTPPGPLGTLALLGAYGGGLVLSAVAVVLAVHFRVPKVKPAAAPPSAAVASPP